MMTKLQKGGTTQPSQQPRSDSPHQALQNGYLQLRGASCGWTLSPLANLILLLALLPPTIVGTLSHWKPPFRVRSHLGIVVFRQLSCRTSSGRKWDWGHTGEVSPRDMHGTSIARKHKEPSNPHHPIGALLSILWKNAPSKQATMKIWVHRYPDPAPRELKAGSLKKQSDELSGAVSCQPPENATYPSFFSSSSSHPLVWKAWKESAAVRQHGQSRQLKP